MVPSAPIPFDSYLFLSFGNFFAFGSVRVSWQKSVKRLMQVQLQEKGKTRGTGDGNTTTPRETQEHICR